jgi:acetolactate synthase I/II/III large subunit
MAFKPYGSGDLEPFQHLRTKPLEIADLLIAYLEQLGVEYVFGIPGGAIEPLYNALARSERRGGPRAIVARHETGAAFMAHGYFKNSGKLGVCCATTGPGATNLITGVASAYENSIPMLVVTPQTVLSNFGRGALQESSDTGVDTLGMFQHCTNYNTLISHADQFEGKLFSALMRAMQTSSPSHISVPLDILRSRILIEGPSFNLAAHLDKPSLIDTAAVNTFYKSLLNSKHAVFVIGDDCSQSIGLILKIANFLKIKIVTTPHGKGLISPYHPLYRGVIGFAGHETAIDLLADPKTDLVIAVGSSLGEWASNGWDQSTLLNRKLMHIEESEQRFTRSPMAHLHVRGNIKSIFEIIHQLLLQDEAARLKDAALERDEKILDFIRNEQGVPVRQFRLEEEAKCHDDLSPIKPQRLMSELTRLFPPSTLYLPDPGNGLAWAIHYLHPYDRRITGERDAKGGLFQGSLEFASMGWAIGAAIGAAFARPDVPIVCITGDGSWLMSGQEITVAIQERLTVVFIILNDSALGMVKHGQRLAGAEPIGFNLPPIDYCAFGKAMGVESFTVRSPQDLLELDINKICTRRGPTLIDVYIDPEEVPPMKTRMRVLGSMQKI